MKMYFVRMLMAMVLLLSSGVAQAAIVDSGNCGASGNNLTWTLTDDGVLTISGSGKMKDWDWNASPFYLNESIKTAVLSEGVTSIGDRTFYGCYSLTSVEIPTTLTSIGKYAFMECMVLTSIEISASVRNIGDYAFSGCYGLTSVEIPASVRSIGVGAFVYCTELNSITVDANNLVYDSRENCNAIIETESNTLLAGCIATVIPESVTSIGDGALSGCMGMSSIEIPGTVTNIGEHAFMECSGITSIEVPASVTSIGYMAFYACSGLTSVYCLIDAPITFNEFFDGETLSQCTLYVPARSVDAYQNAEGWKEFMNILPINASDVIASGTCGAQGDNLTWTLTEDGVLTIEGSGDMEDWNYISPFYYDSNIKTVVLSEGVTSIGDGAFEGCSGLTTIEIPEAVTSIGAYAFYDCDGLTSIEIPEAVTSIGNSAIWKCSGLTSIIVDANNTVYDSRENCKAIIETATNTLMVGCKTTEIPASVTSIGQHAFLGCSGLTSIVIPEAVTSIGDNAFGQCESLTSILIPKAVTSIGMYAFSGCSSLTSIVIPKAVTSIGESAFSGCKGLTSIIVDANNTLYDSRENCNAIIETATNTLVAGCNTTIIPESVTSIGGGAFKGCSGLTSIAIPEAVTNIGFMAFYDCHELTTIVIPEAVTNIGLWAFGNCIGLTSVYAMTKTPITYDDFFIDFIFSQCTLYVPAGSVDIYQNAEGWKEFGNIVEIGEDDGNDKILHLYGDVNHDGRITIADVNILIEIVLGRQKAEEIKVEDLMP